MKLVRALLFPPVFFLIDAIICLGIPTLLALPARGNPNYGDITVGYYYCGFGLAVILFALADITARIMRKRESQSGQTENNKG